MGFKNFLTSVYSFFCETPDARKKRKEKEELNDIRKATGVKSPDALYKDDPMFEPLSWFYTTKGLDTLKKYMSSQKYFEQDKIEEKYGGLKSILEFSEFYREETLPYIFFYGFICKVGIPSIKYCADKKSNDKIYTILVKILSDAAKPYYRNQDGEPHKKEDLLDHVDFLLMDKNIVLKFMTTFRCFDFDDDEKGTLLEKLQIICFVLLYLQSNLSNNEILLNDTWLFETSTYLNEFGILKSPKTFLKYALNASSDKTGKKYFKE